MKGFNRNPNRHSLCAKGAKSRKRLIPVISILPTPRRDDIEILSHKYIEQSEDILGIIPEMLNYSQTMFMPKDIERKFNEVSSADKADAKMTATAKRLVKGAKNQREALKRIYVYVSKRFKSIYTLQYLLGNADRFIPERADKIWNRKLKVEPCHTQSIVLRAFLLASGRFKDDEVRFQVRWVKNVPHVYLIVYLRDEKKWVYADPWVQDYIWGAQKRPEIALGKRA